MKVDVDEPLRQDDSAKNDIMGNVGIANFC